jgi:hypothetical protein
MRRRNWRCGALRRVAQRMAAAVQWMMLRCAIDTVPVDN